MVEPKSIGFQWERYEAWRHHPLLKLDKKNFVPGLGVGIAMFIGFKLWESTAPQKDHH
jgi:NADH dehydrogenase (ubiquinone) 1 beta subcomplex subunit 3